MKLIKPYFEIIEQEPGIQGIYKQIEALEYFLDIVNGKVTEEGALEKAQTLCEKALDEIKENEEAEKAKKSKSSFFGFFNISF